MSNLKIKMIDNGWRCPVCSDWFWYDIDRKEHIAKEVKELKEALSILRDL